MKVRQRGGRTTVVVLLGVLGVLLAGACAPVEGPADRPPDREPVQVDESLGVVRVPPGSPVEVRVVLDGQGDDEGLEAVIRAAFEAAVEDFGAVQQGFRIVLGPPIPTDCDRASGERAGRTVADEADVERIVAVLGPQCTPTLLGLQSVTSSAGLVIVTPRPQETTLTEGPDGLIGQDRAEGTFRTAPSALAEARAAAQHAFEDLELERAAVLHDGSIESKSLAEAFQRRFESLGGTVVVSQQVPEELGPAEGDAAPLGPMLDAITSNAADLVFLPLGTDALLATLEGLGSRARLSSLARLTTSTSATAAVLMDDASVGLLITSPAMIFTDATSAVTGMSGSQTLERVSAASGTGSPSGWFGYAYDAATLLLKALEDSSLIDVDGTFVLSRAELRQTMARTTFGGLTGQIRCSTNGDCGPTRLVVHERTAEGGGALAELPITATLGD